MNWWTPGFCPKTGHGWFEGPGYWMSMVEITSSDREILKRNPPFPRKSSGLWIIM